MKNKIKVARVVLLVVLVSIISFVGIYHKEKNKMVNFLPDYSLDSTLVGYRKLVLNVDKSSFHSAEKKSEENTTAENNTVENAVTTEENTVENAVTAEENTANEVSDENTVQNTTENIQKSF